MRSYDWNWSCLKIFLRFAEFWNEISGSKYFRGRWFCKAYHRKRQFWYKIRVVIAVVIFRNPWTSCCQRPAISIITAFKSTNPTSLCAESAHVLIISLFLCQWIRVLHFIPYQRDERSKETKAAWFPIFFCITFKVGVVYYNFTFGYSKKRIWNGNGKKENVGNL